MRNWTTRRRWPREVSLMRSQNGVQHIRRRPSMCLAVLDIGIKSSTFLWRSMLLSISATSALRGPVRARSRAPAPLEWVDPFVGLCVRHQLGPGKELQFLGDVGGFGVGSDF